MTTATLHERDARGVFDTTPEPILTACRKLLDARRASVAAAGRRFPEEISYAEMMRIHIAVREASVAAEDAIGEHQGKHFLAGLYRVDGWLVGMGKPRGRGKGGLQLVVYPEKK